MAHRWDETETAFQVDCHWLSSAAFENAAIPSYRNALASAPSRVLPSAQRRAGGDDLLAVAVNDLGRPGPSHSQGALLPPRKEAFMFSSQWRALPCQFPG